MPNLGSIRAAVACAAVAALVAASVVPDAAADVPPGGGAGIIFDDVSGTHLPGGGISETSMDARAVDVDDDGDLDLVVAVEFGRNVLLINDGSGRFTDESSARLPQPINDSEDIAVADFDLVNGPDIVFVSEDDLTNEYYWNDGAGFFTSAPGGFPVTGVSNAVVAAELTGDAAVDLLIGNRSQNFFLRNDGAGGLIDQSGIRLPADTRTTQDLELGDVDGDLDLDLVVGNEDGNRLLLNDGFGFFTDATPGRLPVPPAGEETREVALGDIDDDGDLDLFVANVNFFQGFLPINRLLVNDGDGFFTEESDARIPFARRSTVDVDFVDIEDDGDLDLLLGNAGGLQLLLNDGEGFFVDATTVLVDDPEATIFDIEAADYNGDGLLDLYLCDFFTNDRLLLAVDRGIFWEFEPVKP